MLPLLLLACTPGKGAAATFATDLSATVHPEISTVLDVSWSQAEAATSWIEFRTEEAGEWAASPPIDRVAGATGEVALGLPSQQAVELRVVGELDGVRVESSPIQSVTGVLPFDLPEPTVIEADPSLQSPEPWILGSMDTFPNNAYIGPFYVWIMDREGRIVWYHKTRDNLTTMFTRVARDGTHILYDEDVTYDFLDPDTAAIIRTTLDGAWTHTIPAPGLAYAYDELDDGTLVSDHAPDNETYQIVARDEDGAIEPLWTCGGNYYSCYSNTVNLSPAQDTVLWSEPENDKVLEIDLASGTILREFGEGEEAWPHSPEEAVFSYQHFPNWTPEGTLLISTHSGIGDKRQRAREYAVDASSQTLTEVWEYGEEVEEYAQSSGEAWRLPNGNTFINYGSGGAAREVTSDGAVAWDIAWEDKHLTGHMSLVADLYALNQGWPEGD